MFGIKLFYRINCFCPNNKCRGNSCDFVSRGFDSDLKKKIMCRCLGCNSVFLINVCDLNWLEMNKQNIPAKYYKTKFTEKEQIAMIKKEKETDLTLESQNSNNQVKPQRYLIYNITKNEFVFTNKERINYQYLSSEFITFSEYEQALIRAKVESAKNPNQQFIVMGPKSSVITHLPEPIITEYQ